MKQFELLEKPALEKIHESLRRAVFRDGSLSASGLAKSVKHNEELDIRDPASNELTAYLATRIMEHSLTTWVIFPKTLTRPIISRTTGGGSYGRHIDMTQMKDIHSRQMRTDLSFTLFLSDPADYEGGELSVQVEGGDFVDFKPPAGEIVIYGSGRLHEVKPVTGGERLVCIGWFESMIYDPEVRNAMWSLMDVQTLLGQQIDKSSDLFQTYHVTVNALRRCLLGRI
jgi:PKHD-type hydroxylase